MNTNLKLLLASQSPRRAELIRQAGLSFEIVVPNVEEIQLPGEAPASFVGRMAREKAENIAAENAIILAADTVVIADTRILGKPVDAEDAAAMLRLLGGRTHQVMTGVYLRFPDRTDGFHVETRVTFRDLSDQEIADYVATGEPMDKAGAYAIQGGAAKMIRRIEGSHSNVIGLPVCEVMEALARFDSK